MGLGQEIFRIDFRSGISAFHTKERELEQKRGLIDSRTLLILASEIVRFELLGSAAQYYNVIRRVLHPNCRLVLSEEADWRFARPIFKLIIFVTPRHNFRHALALCATLPRLQKRRKASNRWPVKSQPKTRSHAQIAHPDYQNEARTKSQALAALGQRSKCSEPSRWPHDMNEPVAT